MFPLQALLVLSSVALARGSGAAAAPPFIGAKAVAKLSRDTTEPSSQEHGAQALGQVAVTSRIVAGSRALETARSDALHHDPFAALLAGEGMMQAFRDGEFRGDLGGAADTAAAGSPHRGLAMRARIVDDEITGLASSLLEHGEAIQVVNLGAGMDMRPFRLAGLEHVRWFEVDSSEVLEYKSGILANLKGSVSDGVCGDGESSRKSDEPRILAECGDRENSGKSGETVGPPPLKVASLARVPLDLLDSENALLPALLAAGFDPTLPTVWVLEAVLYYMDAAAVQSLLRTMAGLGSGDWTPRRGDTSPAELLGAAAAKHVAARRDDKGPAAALPGAAAAKHVAVVSMFNEELSSRRDIWKSSFEELQRGEVFYRAGWRLRGQAATVVELSRKLYGAELWRPPGPPCGGAEHVFVLELDKS